jgi:hypothetical protein
MEMITSKSALNIVSYCNIKNKFGSWNNLLKSMGKETKDKKDIKEAIAEYKLKYKQKPTRNQLITENVWIYGHFQRKGLLNKYCKSPTFKTLNDAKKEFRRIYGNKKPTRNSLDENHTWIYKHFMRNNLLYKYCKYCRVRK